MRIALYARISTKDKSQNAETQMLQLRAYAAQRQADISEYVDIGVSGSKDSRPELDRMMAHARAHGFEAVVVARFDRFARSTRHLILALEEFGKLNIQFISLAEAIDTASPMGKLVFTLIGAIAELERSMIKERVVAGLARARKEGKKLGRPNRIVDRERVRAVYDQTKSLRETATIVGVGKDTVASIVNEGAAS